MKSTRFVEDDGGVDSNDGKIQNSKSRGTGVTAGIEVIKKNGDNRTEDGKRSEQ